MSTLCYPSHKTYMAAPAPAAHNNNHLSSTSDDDLFFLDFGDQHHQHQSLLDIFDPAAVDAIPGLDVGGGDANSEEEEELEWLSNKDAFPAVETCFELCGAGQQSSPVSVLEEAAAPPYRVPVRPRSKGRRRPGRGVMPVFKPHPAPAARRTRRRCRHCETEETPQWRAGPDGPNTLCNACGVRYKSGRLVPEYRPASSPTFSALHHSNSHRRILEMRRRRGGAAAPSGRKRNPKLPAPPPAAETAAL